MTDFAAPYPDIDLLRTRLQSARRRYLVRACIVALLVACCAGMAAYLLLRVGAILGVSLPGIVVAASGGLAFGVMMIRGVLLLPSPAALAVKADHVSGGREIFRTVSEPRAIGTHDVFARRLAREAEGLATQIAPARLVPGVDRALIGITLALAIAVLAVNLVWPLAPSSDTPPSAIEGAELQAIITSLDDIAVGIESEAIAQGDQYLMAVSRTLSDMARETAARPSIDRTEMAGTLDRLASHAASALSASPDTSDEGRSLIDRLTQLGQDVQQGVATAPAARIGLEAPQPLPSPLAPEDTTGTAAPVEGGVGTSTAPGARQSDIVPDDLPTGPVEGPCQIDGEESCMGPADTNYSADRSMPTGDAAQALGSTSRSEAEMAGREGMLIGAASQSGRGDSALAGQGTEDLFGPDAAQSLDALREFLTVASDRIADGSNSTQQDRAPEQAAPADPGGVLAASGGQWRKLPEQPGNHGAISASRRGVLVQYFDRPVED